MEYDNTNRGSIWRNDRKQSPTHADFAGSINIEGVDYWLNGWLRKENANPKAPSMTFSVTRKEKQPESKPSNDGFRDDPVPDFDQDHIPF